MALVKVDKNQINKLHNETKLSLARDQNVASMLSSAPLTLNLLGQVRLLAFSEKAASTTLRKPAGTEKFENLKYETLPGCMQQLVDEAQNSFHIANMNMHDIIDAGPYMFGPNGHVNQILQILTQEPEKASKMLTPTMDELKACLKKCEQNANDTYDHFDHLRKVAGEINYGIGNEISITQKSREETNEELASLKVAKEVQEKLKEDLDKKVDEYTRELDEERGKFQKGMDESVKRRNEFKDMGLRAAWGLQSGVSSAFNTITGVVRDVPKLAITGAQAVGAFGGATVKFEAASESVQLDPPASQAVDPIYIDAARFPDYLADLNQLISGDLLHMLQEKDADYEIIKCIEEIKSLQVSLKSCKSKQTPKIQKALSKAAEVGNSVLASRSSVRSVARNDDEWQELVATWKKRAHDLFLEGSEFDAAAKMQSGMAFGQDLQSIATTSRERALSDSSDPKYKALQARRQARIMAARLAMDAARDNLKKDRERIIENQKKTIEMTGKMKALSNKEVTFSQIQHVLLESLDCISQLQHQIYKLLQYFHGFSTAIDNIANKQVATFLRAVSAGIDNDKVGYKLAYGPAFSRVGRDAFTDSLLSIRTQFSMVLDKARLYETISEAHIMPCLGEMSKLKVGASPEEQNRQKDELATLTAEASAKIEQAVNHQYEVYKSQAEARIKELVDEEKNLALPGLPEDHRQAITNGVQRATAEVDMAITAECDQEESLGGTLELDNI